MDEQIEIIEEKGMIVKATIDVAGLSAEKDKKNKTNYYILITMWLTTCNFYLIGLHMDDYIVIIVVFVSLVFSVLMIYMPEFIDYLEDKFGKKKASSK